MNDHYSTLIAEKENNINLQQSQNEQLVNKQRINYRIRCTNCGEPGHKICDNVVAPGALWPGKLFRVGSASAEALQRDHGMLLHDSESRGESFQQELQSAGRT